MNNLLMVDSYKNAHHSMYPENTSEVYSYFESRGGRFDKTTFFGLQYYLKKYLCGEFFTARDLDEANAFYPIHMGINPPDFKYILEKYAGKLPIEIHAVEEGTSTEVKNAQMVIFNTDPECFWLTSWLETLLMKIWYPSTIATQSMEIRHICQDFLAKTGTPTNVPFMCHDFGYRGVSSEETAALGAAAHLMSFRGTDTLAGISMINEFYANEEKPDPKDYWVGHGMDQMFDHESYRADLSLFYSRNMHGYSVPAAEHTCIIPWGKDHEEDMYRNIFTQFPTGIASIVGDTYDIDHSVSNIFGKSLADIIKTRQGKTVIRLDSGDPEVEILDKLTKLSNCFGMTVNEKGYKVLPPYLGILQGDGIDLKAVENLLGIMMVHGWSADNIVFGSGGGLLQKVNRDTSRYAIKGSNYIINGVNVEGNKSPKGQPDKASKKGKFALILTDNKWETIPLNQLAGRENHLKPVYRNGTLLKNFTFAEVQKNAGIL